MHNKTNCGVPRRNKRRFITVLGCLGTCLFIFLMVFTPSEYQTKQKQSSTLLPTDDEEEATTTVVVLPPEDVTNNENNNNTNNETTTTTEKQQQQQQPKQWFDFDQIVQDNQLVRAFPIPSNATIMTNGSPWWCSSGNKQTAGLLYVKTPKCASSTLASVGLRISIQQGQRRNQECSFHGHTVGTLGHKYSHRDPRQSFLWSGIRDPAKRAISRAFFNAAKSKRKKNITNPFLFKQFRNSNAVLGIDSDGKGGFLLNYLSLDPLKAHSAWTPERRTEVQLPNQIIDIVRSILTDYDFIVVAERLEESIVVLQFLLGGAEVVPTGDLVSFASKASGSYAWLKSGCVPLTKSFVTPEAQDYLSSQEWYAKNYGDYVLYKAVNASLDATIQHIGYNRVQKAIQSYRYLQNKIKEQCENEVVFQCTENGTDQHQRAESNCYDGDKGCGYPCFDRIVAEEDDDNEEIQ